MRSLTYNDLHKFKPQIARWSFMRKLRNPIAGLSWFGRCSDGTISIVSRHWPHLLCWSWAIYFNSKNLWNWRFSKQHTCIVWGPFRVSWQNYDWMVACGPIQDEVLKDVASQLGLKYESHLVTR